MKSIAPPEIVAAADPAPADPQPVNWVAELPVTLSGAEKRCLETVKRFGSYTAGADPDADLAALETLRGLKLIRQRRQYETRAAVYALTDTGRLWLRRCTAVPAGEDPA